jgi:hypothetical protein
LNDIMRFFATEDVDAAMRGGHAPSRRRRHEIERAGEATATQPLMSTRTERDG